VTLLELVVTLTILAVVGGIALQAFRLGSRSWTTGERRADRGQRARVLAGLLGQELASLAPVDAGTMPVIRGGSDWIQFHSSATGQGPLPFSAMARSVAYYVQPANGLVVEESHPLAADGLAFGSRSTPRVIDPSVIRVHFRYLARKNLTDEDAQWAATWNSEEHEEHLGASAMTPMVGGRSRQAADHGAPSDAVGEVPLAVEVTIVREDGSGGHTSSFVFPIRVGRSL
jgi:hypothetical protein